MTDAMATIVIAMIVGMTMTTTAEVIDMMVGEMRGEPPSSAVVDLNWPTVHAESLETAPLSGAVFFFMVQRFPSQSRNKSPT